MSTAETVTRPTTRQEVDHFIRTLTVEILLLEDTKPEAISATEQDFLIALGANSIDALELIIEVEEKLAIEFDDDQLNPELVQTLEHFVLQVCAKLGIEA